MSYLVDSLYLVNNIEIILKKVFDNDISILDLSYAIFIGARIDLPVSIIPILLICLFTNYNEVGTRN
jgi:hypothetical protein